MVCVTEIVLVYFYQELNLSNLLKCAFLSKVHISKSTEDFFYAVTIFVSASRLNNGNHSAVILLFNVTSLLQELINWFCRYMDYTQIRDSSWKGAWCRAFFG